MYYETTTKTIRKEAKGLLLTSRKLLQKMLILTCYTEILRVFWDSALSGFRFFNVLEAFASPITKL